MTWVCNNASPTVVEPMFTTGVVLNMANEEMEPHSNHASAPKPSGFTAPTAVKLVVVMMTCPQEWYHILC